MLNEADLKEDEEKWTKLVKLCDTTITSSEFKHQKDWACEIKTQLDEDSLFNTQAGKGPWQYVSIDDWFFIKSVRIHISNFGASFFQLINLL